MRSAMPTTKMSRHLCALQVNQLLEVGDRNQGTRKYTALDKWATQLMSIHTAVQNKMC